MHISLLLIIAFTLLTSYILYQLFLSPLRKIPGPFLAKLTNIWRFVNVWKGQPQITLRKLHEKHGAYVRIGPNVVSIADSSCVKKIYTLKGDFAKSQGYVVGDAHLPDGTVKHNLFSATSERERTDLIRPVQKLFNLGNILTYEEQLDHVIKLLVENLDHYAKTGEVVDMWKQTLYVGYDTIGSLTYGAPYGYVKAQGDFNNFIDTTRDSFEYFGLIQQMPWLDPWLGRNQLTRSLFTTFDNLTTTFAIQIQERLSRASDKDRPRDLVEDAIAANGGPDSALLPEIIGTLSGLVVAGADPSAQTMTGMIYELLKHPEVLEKLRNEIDAVALPSPAPYTEAKDSLPYLSAVLKETLRCHPANQLVLERVVPETGAKFTDDAPFLPPGTIVGCSAAVVHMDKAHFGPDADEFKPERWQRLPGESEEESASRIARLSDVDLSFGAGRRTCTGKQIALVEMWKVMATLLQRYDFELAGPPGWTYKTRTYTSAYPEDLPVRVKRRVV